LRLPEFLRQAAKEGDKVVSHCAVRIKSMKNPNDLSEIEPTTCQLEAQGLKQLCHHILQAIMRPYTYAVE
jgi:hypothetical protein